MGGDAPVPRAVACSILQVTGTQRRFAVARTSLVALHAAGLRHGGTRNTRIANNTFKTIRGASKSITSPGSSRPAAFAGGNACPDSSARCAHTTSRAAARALPTAPSRAVSRRSSSRQHVESDATAPNNAA